MSMHFFRRNVKTNLGTYLWFLIIIFSIWYTFFYQRNPCDRPIRYKIGILDERFGVSREDLLQMIDQASNVWGITLNKKLFEYSPSGELTISLIYDERQLTTQTNALLKADLAKINKLASSVKQQYVSLEEKHQLLEKDYRKMLIRLEQHQADYSNKVDDWNNGINTSQDIYFKLTAQRTNLLIEQQILNAKRLELNKLVGQINTFINKYNLLVNNANANINTINTTAGKEFEEGIYNPSKKEIDIYEFSSKQKLLRVLTHELGHALGVPHNENPLSIMYFLNESSSLDLTTDDFRALKAKCINTSVFSFNGL